MTKTAEFTPKISWVSPQARAFWHEKMTQCSRISTHLKILSVQEGLRQAVIIQPSARARQAPLGMKHASILVTNNTQPEAEQVEIWFSQKNQHLAEKLTKSTNISLMELSELEGLPTCCAKARTQTSQQLNLIQQLARMPTLKRRITETGSHIVGHAECNPFLSMINLQLLPYIPCSSACRASLEYAQEYVTLAESAYQSKTSHLLELLQMPLRISSLFGICTVHTPIFVLAYPDEIFIDEHSFTFEAKRQDSNEELSWRGSVYGSKYPYTLIERSRRNS